jgi:holo-[acyl-carrier protein] synthase
MILGTGIDIIEVERIRLSYERFGERFLNRILTPAEIAYCLGHRKPAAFLAARFAAKEAISKSEPEPHRTARGRRGHPRRLMAFAAV